MKITVNVNSLEELDFLIQNFEWATRPAVQGQIDDSVDWSTWTVNKKREHQLTWREFTEKCDIDVTTIWRYRQGGEPSPRSIMKMVQAFGA